jgi:hypothetical protein
MILDEPDDPRARGWSLMVEMQEDGAAFATDMRCPRPPVLTSSADRLREVKVLLPNPTLPRLICSEASRCVKT